MIWKLLLGVVLGFGGHCATYDVSCYMPAPELSRHGIGVLLAWPVFVLLNRDAQCQNSNFVLALGSVGLGAAIARFARVLLAV